MSAPLFDRLRELVPALGTVSGLAYADTHGTAVLGIEAQRALITALTPCACGAVAGQDCAPDCDLDAYSDDCERCPRCNEGAGFGVVLRRHGLALTCSACGFDEDKAGAWVSDKAGAWSHCGTVATPQREGAGMVAACVACGDVAVIDCGAP